MKTNREARALWPVGKTGEVPPIGIYPWSTIGPVRVNYQRQTPSAFPERQNQLETRRALYLHEARHSYAIEALPKSGALKRRPYLYMCIRCKWMFRVNDRLGSIVALDENNQPLPEPENSRRAATFEKGPCPALRYITDRRITQVHSTRWLTRLQLKARSWLSEVWQRWSGDGAARVPQGPHPTTMIMPDDALR